jgi:hypothetical protein
MGMNLDNLAYPVLCFSQGLARVKRSADALATCTKPALRKGGWYEDLLVVDSTGMALRVTGATKLHGVGPFWGYNIFLNQRIKVRPHVEGPPLQLSLEDVRRRVLDSFRRWHGWSSRGDFQDLVASVETARSIPQIIERLSEPNPP